MPIPSRPNSPIPSIPLFHTLLTAATLTVSASLTRADPPLPIIPNQTFNITTYGATGADTTADTASIQNAINAASAAGGGTVLLPAGTYLSGPLTLASNINLNLASGAILKALPFGTYPAAGTNFLTASHLSNFEITGAGTIDGQGSPWWAAFNADSTITRPRLLNITNSSTVYLQGVTLQNSPQFNVAFGSTSNVTIDALTISNPSSAPNTDGIDPAGNNYLIKNCNISTGDDNIAVKPGSSVCSNITITNCTFGTGHGVSVGGQTNLGLTNMTVSNCTFNGTSNGIRLKAGRGFGGTVSNLTYSNLTMTNVQHPIDITSYYLNGGTASQPANPATDPAQPVDALTPFWQNITLSNIAADLTGTKAAEAGIIYGLPEAPINGITLNNVDVTATKGLELYNVRNAFLSPDSTLTVSSGAKELTFNATFATPEPASLAILSTAALLLQRRSPKYRR